jgi:hypothetical protein
MELEPVGLLVVRAWNERGSERPLRAEVKLTCDIRHGFQRQLTLSDTDAVQAAVRAWLEEIVDGWD